MKDPIPNPADKRVFLDEERTIEVIHGQVPTDPQRRAEYLRIVRAAFERPKQSKEGAE